MHIRTFYPEVLLAAVPNGAAVSPKQRLRLAAEGLLPGFPDLMILEPRGSWHGLFVEMKSMLESAVTSRAQARVHGELRARGYCTHVCHGYDKAKETVMDYLDTF